MPSQSPPLHHAQPDPPPAEAVTPHDFARLFARFNSPITELNCGDKCAPYNARGVPFCCDTRHAVPSAYAAEWLYLSENSDLWHIWQGQDQAHAAHLRQSTPPGQVLIECQGHLHCQRGYRSIACRSFPFYPYIDLQGQFLGMAYYWEYEDRCWVISNLASVSSEYLSEFIAAFEQLFNWYPGERATFRAQAIRQRQVFGRRRRAIPLLHRNGAWYKLSPRSGRLRRADPQSLPLFGSYAVASRLRFPGE